MRWNDLGRVLLAHPAGHPALHSDPDLLADAACGWRGAELADEIEVVPFCPGLDHLAILPLVDADASYRPTGAGRCEARELAAVRPLAVPAPHDLVVGRARSVRASTLGVAAGLA
jgi:hypothetical protein